MGIVDSATLRVPIEGAIDSYDIMSGAVLEPQCQTQWCWAAVTRAVQARLFGQMLTLCEIASTTLDRSCCDDDDDCANAARSCNRQTYLQRAFSAHGIQHTYIRGAPVLDTIHTEIQAGRPVPILVDWDGGGGHFFVIVGLDPRPPGVLMVADSRRASDDDPTLAPITRRQLPDAASRFDVAGRWTWTFLLRP